MTLTSITPCEESNAWQSESGDSTNYISSKILTIPRTVLHTRLKYNVYEEM
jgi:hypothetical protein